MMSGSSASPSAPPSSAHWCSFPITLESVDWLHYKDSLQAAANTPRLPPGLHFQIVESEAAATRAVHALRASMRDQMLAIDLEWCPEGMYGVQPHKSKVALLQIASGSLCLLIRTSKMGFQLPAAVRDLLDDPTITFVTLGWMTADERMFQRTFKRGWRDFGGGRGDRCFVDAQDVAIRCGYVRPGLASLTRFILGFEPGKSKSVSRSNWASGAPLRPNQIVYSAMDAFLTGYVFRALRSWHTSAEGRCSVRGCGAGALGWPAAAASAAVRAMAGSCGGCGRFSCSATDRAGMQVQLMAPRVPEAAGSSVDLTKVVAGVAGPACDAAAVAHAQRKAQKKREREAARASDREDLELSKRTSMGGSGLALGGAGAVAKCKVAVEF